MRSLRSLSAFLLVTTGETVRTVCIHAATKLLKPDAREWEWAEQAISGRRA
jgi:hypothetical protein